MEQWIALRTVGVTALQTSISLAPIIPFHYACVRSRTLRCLLRSRPPESHMHFLARVQLLDVHPPVQQEVWVSVHLARHCNLLSTAHCCSASACAPLRRTLAILRLLSLAILPPFAAPLFLSFLCLRAPMLPVHHSDWGCGLCSV